jgi:hypothetical protein
MMKKHLFIVTMLLIGSFKSFAQKYELGKVTIEELKEKVCPKDSSAVAVVLFQVGKTSFEYSQIKGFEVITQIDTKIKIYKKEGYSYADKYVSYFVGNNMPESVSFSKAVTYNCINDKIEKTKLKSDGEFNEKRNKNWYQRKIALPDVKEGSIIEYRVEIRSPYDSNLPEWSFQKNIPVNYSEYTTRIPEYYIYNVRNKGFILPKVTVDKNHKSIELDTRISPKGINSGYTHEVGTVNYQEIRTTYLVENLPAIKDEAYVNNIDNYVASLIHELSSKKFPNSPFQNFATDWESVAKKIYESDDFGSELKKTGYFEKDIDAVLQGINLGSDRINAIFNYVKSRMNWNDYNSLYCDEGVKKAYQEKTGNAAEINLMLTAMLRYAGMEANPVLVSTRDNGINIFPSRTAFNYVVAAVEIENDLILLDATSKNAQPNILPFRALNWFGRIIRKEGSSAEVDLMPKSSSKEMVSLFADIDPKGKITGKMRDQYFDYNAFGFRERNKNISKDSYLEKLEKKYQGIEIGEYEVLNKSDLSKPVMENYSFTHTNGVEIIGDKMYFSPLFFLATTENPFKQEIREYPVDFVFPHQEKYLINITIPDGYAIESMPVPSSIAMGDNLGSFKFNISNTEKQIQLVVTQDINSAIFSSEYYNDLKAFFTEMIKKQNEKIILKKA